MRRRVRIAPVLTRKLAPMPLQFANPVWVEEDQLEWAYHVQHITLEPPGTQAQLEQLAGRLHSELLDRHRPLWRMAVIDGLASGQVAYYFQIHHAVLDGQAGVLLAQALFDVTPKPRALPRARRRRWSTRRRRARRRRAAPRRGPVRQAAAPPARCGAHARRADRRPARREEGRGAGGLGQNFSFGPKTALNVPVTGERGFAAVTLPLVALEALAEAHEAKLNDIVLALCGGALRRYLAAHGGVPDKPLIATMPISLRRRQHRFLGAGHAQPGEPEYAHRRPGAAAAGHPRCGRRDNRWRGARGVIPPTSPRSARPGCCTGWPSCMRAPASSTRCRRSPTW